MNIMRQALAMVIVLCSYSSLRRKALFKFVLTIAIAACFHKSALIFLLAWSCHFVQISKKFVVMLALLGVFAYISTTALLSFVFQSNILPSYYLDSEYLDGGKVAPFINFVIYFLIFAFVYTTKSYEKNKDNNLMLILLAIGLVLSVVNLKFSAFSRVTSYFTMFSVILLPNSLCTIRSTRKYVSYVSIIFILFTLYYFVVIKFRPYWIHIYPYDFFF